MWISTNSTFIEPVLIEIESPKKAWFTEKGQPTSKFIQAVDQINQWRAWFEEPINIQAFKNCYKLNEGRLQGRKFKPSYLLIFGREEEANRSSEFKKKRDSFIPNDTLAMTYDRLNPDRNADQYFCMKANIHNGDTIFEAISVPATIQWTPILAKERSLVTNLEEAIKSNEHISEKRKEFLIRRLPYWNEWSKNGKGTMRNSDRE